ncbi:MAG: diaminopimelate epimerase [Candidatus Dadabacteria bacterium]|nr:diaminopimelate epimerase [Candidatus Dadabacteria bacterium]NIQ15005.1 diaminopimelate epimerase [Candidatus Dadabacteria bacterium]
MNSFVKSHGLGNDYIVLNSKDIDFNLDINNIKLICDRNYGIGSDGILLLTSSEKADFGLRILNPDGSEAEKSGNGLRIFAKYLFEHGHTAKNIFSIDTPGGLVTAELEVEEDLVHHVTVEMGHASFNSKNIPVTGKEREVVEEELRINGDILKFTAVTVGNPHCVVFIDNLNDEYIKKIGPLIENNPIFPNRTNVQLAKVISKDEVEILIWERGAGYTLASGSSSCAVAAACVRSNLTSNKLKITMPGGELDIIIRDDWSIKMRGEVEEVSSGQFSKDFIRRLKTSL